MSEQTQHERDTNLARAVFNTPWAIAEAKLVELVEVVQRHMSGSKLTNEQISAAIGAAAVTSSIQQSNGIAVIPVYGVIGYRMNMLSAFSGGTSLQRLHALLADAMQDESVSSIVLRFETPGGSVDGLPELAATIREMRGRGTKRFVASVDVRAFSAGYWLASQCDEICCTPSGAVGSIGVVTQYCDDSEAMKKAGLAVEVMSVPDKKGESMQPGPLSTDRRQRILDVMSQYYAMFVGDVAKGRNVSTATVKADYGGGDVLTAAEAKKAGMIDRIETFTDTIARLGGRKGAAVTVRAASGAAGPSLQASADRADEGDGEGCPRCDPACPCEEDECEPECPTCLPACACATKKMVEASTDDAPVGERRDDQADEAEAIAAAIGVSSGRG